MKKLWKQSLAVVSAAALLLTAGPFTAAAASAGEQPVGASSGTTGNCEWTLDNNGVLTISGDGFMADYDYDNRAPWGYDISQVIIQDGVRSVGSQSFCDCENLTNITIPGSVTEIGESAFWGCYNLTDVTTSEGLLTIGSYSFGYCENLNNVTLPDSLEMIDEFAFCNCYALTDITIPRGVIQINWNSFFSCSSLTGISVAAENTVYDSRDNCNAIIETGSDTLVLGCQNTVIPDGITAIGDSAFLYCDNLISITLPDSVTSIGNGAFSGCRNLVDINLPDNLTSIGDYAFGVCESLNSITFPSGLRSIGEWAFCACPGIRGITIPENVIYIGKEAFTDCTGLLRIVVKTGNPVYDSRNKCNAIIESDSNTLLFGCQNTVIPDSVEAINSFAFHNCVSLTEITIPESVRSIGEEAFAGCAELSQIRVAEGNPVYDSRNDCNAVINTSLNELVVGCQSTVIPEDVTRIGDFAFAGALLDITILPDKVTYIGPYAFYGCYDMTSIVIPPGVTYIDETAFWGCDDCTIYGTAGSYAQRYAHEYEIPFIAIDGMIIGDVDDDSYVTIADATLLQRYLAEFVTLDSNALLRADVSGDGTVSIADVTDLQRIIAEYF